MSAYLQEYARFREDFRKYKEALRIAEDEKRKLKAECPTFYAQFAWRIDAEILP